MNRLTRTFASTIALTVSLAAQTWTRQGPSPTHLPLEAVDFVDAQTGWVGGGDAADGGIWRTDDGGATWQVQLQNTGYASVRISDLHMLDNSTGWAVGDANMGSFFGVAIYRTTDGATWQEASLPAPPAGGSAVMATKVQFVSASVGFVSTRPAAGLSHLYRTTDGGNTWQFLRDVALDSWCFVDANVGWAADTSQNYIRTSNGGTSWSTVSAPVAGSLGSLVSHVFSYDDAVVRTFAGSAFLVHRTSNGGASWTPASGQTNAEQFFLDGQLGWSINKGVSATTDGGATWTVQLTPNEVPETAWDLCIVDAQTLILAGDYGLLLRSTDGGASWQQLSNGTGQPLTTVRFVNHDVGWAVGGGYTALRTEDAGQTWVHQQTDLTVFDTANSPTNLWAFSEQSAIAQLGAFGNTHSGFMSTDDGGQTWTKQTSWPLGQGYFADRFRGWLVSKDATTCWRTIDGGGTWVAQPTGVGPLGFNAFVSDVFFVDDQYGWCTGYPRRLFRTTDGGQSWTSMPAPLNVIGSYIRVMFADRDNGWIVGYHGLILRTTDGGLTWIDQTIPNSIDEHISDLVVIGPDEAYICSGDQFNGFGSLLGGFVRHTVDGGVTWPYEGSELHDGYVASVAVVGGDLWTAGSDGAIFHSAGTRGLAVPFGAGCVGSANLAPELFAVEEPIIGRRLTLRVDGVFGATLGVIAFGSSNTSWGAAALPASLAPLGAAATCNVLVAPEALVTIATDAAGQGEIEWLVPYSQSFLGLSIYTQALILDPLLTTPFAVAVSAGLEVQLGGR